MAAVPYVATAALERLRLWAPTWTAPVEVGCHPGLRAGMRACVEAQLADGAAIADATVTCGDAEALGPVFDAVCAGPLGAPFCGLSFEAFYTGHVPACAAALADELAGLCVSDADCGGAPRRCWGTVNDASTQLGVCQDIRGVPGQGDQCSATLACGTNLVCAGLSLWPEGMCVGTWMAGSFTMDVPQRVAATAGASFTTTVVVHGLATVPIDLWVDLDVRGTDPRRLRVWLENPQGERGRVWDGATGGATIPARLVPGPGIAHDNYVNGGWKIVVETIGAGSAGTLHAATVHVTSQWD